MIMYRSHILHHDSSEQFCSRKPSKALFQLTKIFTLELVRRLRSGDTAKESLWRAICDMVLVDNLRKQDVTTRLHPKYGIEFYLDQATS
jgi:hypothetical protein